MTKKELAQLLGISGSMVSKLSKIGMPTDTLERAQKWRKRHLEPGRMKGTRFDPDKIRPAVLGPKPSTPQPAEFVERARAMLNIATVANDAGQSIAPLIPSLRAALHAVPVHERASVLLPVNVMDLLTANVVTLLSVSEGDSKSPEGQPMQWDGHTMSDAEATAMGEFWYQVAAGEWRVT